MATNRIVFHTGGADFHPTRSQAGQVAGWLGGGYDCRIYDGAAAFDQLDEARLLVLMGMFWPGGGQYVPLSERHKAYLRAYVASGRPLLVHHGAIASYDDWNEFAAIAGFRWVWDTSGHGPVGEYRIRVNADGHPLTAGVSDFDTVDEAYYNLEVAPGLNPRVHATTTTGELEVPVLFSARHFGGGRYVYIGLGHDERSFEAPGMRRLWLNAVQWLLDGS